MMKTEISKKKKKNTYAQVSHNKRYSRFSLLSDTKTEYGFSSTDLFPLW